MEWILFIVCAPFYWAIDILILLTRWLKKISLIGGALFAYAALSQKAYPGEPIINACIDHAKYDEKIVIVVIQCILYGIICFIALYILKDVILYRLSSLFGRGRNIPYKNNYTKGYSSARIKREMEKFKKSPLYLERSQTTA